MPVVVSQATKGASSPWAYGRLQLLNLGSQCVSFSSIWRFVISSIQTYDTRRFWRSCEPHRWHPIHQRRGGLLPGPHTLSKHVCINNCYYEVVCFLQVCDSLHGRTIVVLCILTLQTVYNLYTVCKVSTHADSGAGLHLCIAYPGVRYPPRCELKSRTLMLSDGIGRMPDKFTYKQAYPIRGHSQEGPLLSQFKGQFGIADVIGYHNCGTEDPHGSTERFWQKGPPWRS